MAEPYDLGVLTEKVSALVQENATLRAQLAEVQEKIALKERVARMEAAVYLTVSKERDQARALARRLAAQTGHHVTCPARGIVGPDWVDPPSGECNCALAAYDTESKTWGD